MYKRQIFFNTSVPFSHLKVNPHPHFSPPISGLHHQIILGIPRQEHEFFADKLGAFGFVGGLLVGRETDAIVFDGAGKLVRNLDFETDGKFGFGMIRREGMDEDILHQRLNQHWRKSKVIFFGLAHRLRWSKSPDCPSAYFPLRCSD